MKRHKEMGLYHLQQLRALDTIVYHPPWTPDVAAMLRRQPTEAEPHTAEKRRRAVK